MHGSTLLLLQFAAAGAEVIAYLGDPQIGFSGNEVSTRLWQR